jgi:hypothetical protein
VSLHIRSRSHSITPCVYQNIKPELFPNSWSEKHGVTCNCEQSWTHSVHTFPWKLKTLKKGGVFL